MLDALRAGGPLRVTELVARTGLSRPTVDAVADDLVRLGWLDESAADDGRARGRPARALAFRADAGYVVGVDIGEVQGARRGRRPARARSSPSGVREFDGDGAAAGRSGTRVARRSRTRASRATQLLAACVGCTGADGPAHAAASCSRSIFPDDFDLAGALAGTLGRRPVVENDCNLGVIAERWCGAAQASTTSSACSRASGSARASWSAAS